MYYLKLLLKIIAVRVKPVAWHKFKINKIDILITYVKHSLFGVILVNLLLSAEDCYPVLKGIYFSNEKLLFHFNFGI